MYCTKCGTTLEESMAYCSHCGTPTERAAYASPSRQAPLLRSRENAKVAGVCGGLAHYFAVDPTLFRLIWLVATICFPPLLLGYLGAWIIIPKETPRVVHRLESSIPNTQA